MPKRSNPMPFTTGFMHFPSPEQSLTAFNPPLIRRVPREHPMTRCQHRMTVPQHRRRSKWGTTGQRCRVRHPDGVELLLRGDEGRQVGSSGWALLTSTPPWWERRKIRERVLQIVDNPARIAVIISPSEQTRRCSAWELAAAVAEDLRGISQTLPEAVYGIFDSSQGPIRS